MRSRGGFRSPICAVLVGVLSMLLLTPLFGAAARAETPATCEGAVAAWVAGCPEVVNECVRGVLCPPGGVLLEAGCSPSDHLRVEVSHATPRVFRQVGGLGLSPVGDFPDWSREPEGRHRVFDKLAACLARDPTLLLPAAPGSPAGPSASPAGAASPADAAPPALPAKDVDVAFPWRFLLGVGLAALLCADRLRRRALAEPGRALGRNATALLPPSVTALLPPAVTALLPLLALFLGTLAIRALTVPMAFFHPNGQGAFWLGFALDPNGRRASYGPGFWELTSAVAQLPFARPETVVMGAQAILGALSAPSAWVITRAVGGSRPLAWGAALAVATSPLLARISQSPSYYATWTSLLFLAAAVLVLGTPRPQGTRDGERARFAVAVLSAGFLVAQAARVTPIGWMAAAVLPLSVAAGPGHLPSRLRWTALAGLGIGATVLVTSGPLMLGVLRGPLGAQWLPQLGTTAPGPAQLLGSAAPFSTRHLLLLLLLSLALLLALLAGSRHRAHAALRLVALAGTLYLMNATCMVRGDPATFQRAFVAMWSPVLLALVVALVADLRTRTLQVACGTAMLTAVAALHAGTWRAETELPTNVLEAGWAEEWREELPAGATVVYLGRVGPNVLALPLYGAHTRVKVEPWVLSHTDPLPDLGALKSNVYYYESSLCAAPEARDFCHRFLERYGAGPMETRTFPARSSASTSFFEGSTVTVGLYRLR